MAPNIMDNERFYSYRKPAWHRLGTVSHDAHSAREAGDIIGVPIIYERPVLIDMGNGQTLKPRHLKAIVGKVSKNGVTQSETYAVVSDRYVTISHDQFLTIFDTITHSRVETLGLLGNGSTLFLTAPMPTFDIKGDEIKNYLLMYNTLDGVSSIRCQPTSVRVVCQNTLQAAFRRTTDESSVFTGIHKSKRLAQDVAIWLQDLWNQVTGITDLLQTAYTAMANMTVRPDDLASVLEAVYPSSDDEEESQTVHVHHNYIMELFEGSQTRSAATIGTAFGLYNAVVEYEDFGRKRSTPRSVMLGGAAERKREAFRQCYHLATHH